MEKGHEESVVKNNNDTKEETFSNETAGIVKLAEVFVSKSQNVVHLLQHLDHFKHMQSFGYEIKLVDHLDYLVGITELSLYLKAVNEPVVDDFIQPNNAQEKDKDNEEEEKDEDNQPPGYYFQYYPVSVAPQGPVSSVDVGRMTKEVFLTENNNRASISKKITARKPLWFEFEDVKCNCIWFEVYHQTFYLARSLLKRTLELENAAEQDRTAQSREQMNAFLGCVIRTLMYISDNIENWWADGRFDMTSVTMDNLRHFIVALRAYACYNNAKWMSSSLSMFQFTHPGYVEGKTRTRDVQSKLHAAVKSMWNCIMLLSKLPNVVNIDKDLVLVHSCQPDIKESSVPLLDWSHGKLTRRNNVLRAVWSDRVVYEFFLLLTDYMHSQAKYADAKAAILLAFNHGCEGDCKIITELSNYVTVMFSEVTPSNILPMMTSEKIISDNLDQVATCSVPGLPSRLEYRHIHL